MCRPRSPERRPSLWVLFLGRLQKELIECFGLRETGNSGFAWDQGIGGYSVESRWVPREPRASAAEAGNRNQAVRHHVIHRMTPFKNIRAHRVLANRPRKMLEAQPNGRSSRVTLQWSGAGGIQELDSRRGAGGYRPVPGYLRSLSSAHLWQRKTSLPSSSSHRSGNRSNSVSVKVIDGSDPPLRCSICSMTAAASFTISSMSGSGL
jgi:hypothetical protein